MTPRLHSVPRIAAIVVASFFLAVVAVVLSVKQLYFMSASIAATVVAALFVARNSLRAVTVRLPRARSVHAGEMVELPVCFTNHGRLPRFLTEVELPQLAALEVDDSVRAQTASLWPGESETVAMQFRLQRRGVADIDRAVLRAGDPLGMFTCVRMQPCDCQLVVYPRVYPLAHLLEAAGADAESWLEHGSRRAADGLDFESVREYQIGDDLRRIHWKSTARHGRFHVVEFERPETRTWAVLVDLRTDVTGEETLERVERALELAASVAAHIIHRGETVALAIAGEEWDVVEANSGPSHLRALYTRMAHAKLGLPLADDIATAASWCARNAVTVCIGLSADRVHEVHARIQMQRAVCLPWVVTSASLPFDFAGAGAVEAPAAMGGASR